jgi:hexulose-6-phosphate isomerase
MINLGVMQGRLIPWNKKKIQFFPIKDWEKEFSICNSIDLKCIEWTIDHHRIERNPIMTRSGRNSIKLLKKKYKIILNSVTADFFMQRPFFKYKKKEMALYKKLFNRFIINASLCDFECIILPLVDNSSLKNNFHENLVINFLQKVSRVLKKYKIKIAIESDYEPHKLKKFISNFDSKYIGINYDMGNSAALRYSFDEEMSCYFSHILNVHIKDKDFKGKSVELGKGLINLKKIIKFFKEKKFNRNMIFQTARVTNGNDALQIRKYKDKVLKWI